MLKLEEMADSVTLQVVDPANNQVINSMELGPQMAGEVPFTGMRNFEEKPLLQGNIFFLRR